MQTYSKFIGQIVTGNNRKIGNKKFLTREIIENLKEAEREINEGKLIPSNVVFKELRDIYGG